MPVLKVWNGSSWVVLSGWKKPKVWNGSAWKRFAPSTWTGTGWNRLSVPQSRTLTVASYYNAGSKYVPSSTDYGYGTYFGSMSSNSLPLWSGGSSISSLSWNTPYNTVTFTVINVASNDSWTTLTINGTAFSRTAAAFTGDGFYGTWTWGTATNPFGTSGTITVSWT